jgi:SH3 domain protein
LISAQLHFAASGAAGARASAPLAARALFVSLAVIAGGTAFAQTETQYVIEQLVVSMNSAADGSGERTAQIQSGDRVEVLERQDDQSRVRIPSGAEGWVRSSYLSSSPPMREQLKARTEELEKLRHEKSKLETDLASARKAASAASSANAPGAAAPGSVAMPTPAPAATGKTEAPHVAPEAATAESAPASNPPLFSSEGILPARPSWILALVASAATLVIGFGLGWRMLDRRIRAKYGGLRIY